MTVAYVLGFAVPRLRGQAGNGADIQERPSYLIVTTPTSAAAGTPFSVTVQAMTGNSQPAEFAGPITFTSTDRAAVLPYFTTIALTTWTNGAATFSVTLNTPGAQNVTAYFPLDTYGSPLITGTSTNIAVAAVPPASSFRVQPSSQTISSGSTVVFNANASETPPPSYQWYYNGSALANGGGVSGVTGPTLVINGATSANAGSYYCVAADTSGSLQSNTAALSVTTTTDIGRLINISCRAQVGTGPNILIAGFVVGGAATSGTESLLLRGSGPALIPFAVTDTLPDPQLQLYSGSTLLATNDGWAGNATIASTAAAVGAFPWTNTSSHDAALFETLDGACTAQIAGQSGDTGIALAEVYDATPEGTYTLTTPRLINISFRAQVGTGGHILIAGFVIGGSSSRSVLIRASGPALVAYGVTGTLSDPELQLNSGSTLLGTNTGWGGNAEIANAAASVGAFAWTNPSSNDSALLVTLPPGAYTAQVSGASGDIGVALVEVYEVP